MKKVFMMAMFGMLVMGTAMCTQSTKKSTDCSSTVECCRKDSDKRSIDAGCMDSSNTSFSPFDGLGLTEGQQVKINKVKAAFVPKKKACLKEIKTNPEEQQKLCKLQRACMSAMKNILTPEQYVAFLENLVVAQNLR